MNETNNWKEIEEKFMRKFAVCHDADKVLYVQEKPNKILAFFKPYFQEKMHDLSISELETVDNNPKE